MIDDIEEVKSFAKHFKERAEELYAENQILMKALKHLVIIAQKDEINKDHLDQALRKARNVIADIDPTVEKCGCCY
jgi:DNA-binding phage protein